MTQLTEEFVKEYEEELENKIMLHFTYNPGYLKLRQAYEHLKNMVSCLFGNDSHMGMVQFFLDQKHLGLDLEGAVARAEQMMERGWSIKEENGKAFILDETMKVVAEVSGPADVMPVEMEMSVEDAYQFLEEKDAKLLLQAALKSGVEKENLKSPSFTYSFVETKLGTENPLFPVAQSYSGLGRIMNKLDSFQSLSNPKSITDLHKEGFRIQASLNPTSLVRAMLGKGSQKLLLRPVFHEVELETGKLIDQKELENLQAKTEFYKKLGINVETPIEIATLGQTYALALPVDNEYRSQDVGDINRMLSAAGNAKMVSRGTKDKIFSQVAAYIVSEVLVFGSPRVTFADFYIDSINHRITKRFLPSAGKLEDDAILEMLENVQKTQISGFKNLHVNPKDSEFREYFGSLLSALPANYKEALNTVDFAAKNKLISLLGDV